MVICMRDVECPVPFAFPWPYLIPSDDPSRAYCKDQGWRKKPSSRHPYRTLPTPSLRPYEGATADDIVFFRLLIERSTTQMLTLSLQL